MITPGPWRIDPRSANHVIAPERPICSVSYYDGADETRQDNDDIARAIALVPEMIENAVKPVVKGFNYDPGHSDLDNEQPITVRMTLGDWRKCNRLLARIEGEKG